MTTLMKGEWSLLLPLTCPPPASMPGPQACPTWSRASPGCSKSRACLCGVGGAQRVADKRQHQRMATSGARQQQLRAGRVMGPVWLRQRPAGAHAPLPCGRQCTTPRKACTVFKPPVHARCWGPGAPRFRWRSAPPSHFFRFPLFQFPTSKHVWLEVSPTVPLGYHATKNFPLPSTCQ